MKIVSLAAAALLCLGAGTAYADGDSGGGGAEDGVLPNTFFTELPGVVATAPGAPPNNVAANGDQTTSQPTSTTSVTLPAKRATGG